MRLNARLPSHEALVTAAIGSVLRGLPAETVGKIVERSCLMLQQRSSAAPNWPAAIARTSRIRWPASKLTTHSFEPNCSCSNSASLTAPRNGVRLRQGSTPAARGGGYEPPALSSAPVFRRSRRAEPPGRHGRKRRQKETDLKDHHGNQGGGHTVGQAPRHKGEEGDRIAIPNTVNRYDKSTPNRHAISKISVVGTSASIGLAPPCGSV